MSHRHTCEQNDGNEVRCVPVSAETLKAETQKTPEFVVCRDSRFKNKTKTYFRSKTAMSTRTTRGVKWQTVGAPRPAPTCLLPTMTGVCLQKASEGNLYLGV